MLPSGQQEQPQEVRSRFVSLMRKLDIQGMELEKTMGLREVGAVHRHGAAITHLLTAIQLEVEEQVMDAIPMEAMSQRFPPSAFPLKVVSNVVS
jgi:hypothetical protein